jgi:RNA polymerase sigma factor (sigma-70 family)
MTIFPDEIETCLVTLGEYAEFDYVTGKPRLNDLGRDAVTQLISEYGGRLTKLLVSLYHYDYRRAKEHLSDEEIEQACRIGACNAARGYNPSRGVKFVTHAALFIRSAVQRETGRTARKEWQMPSNDKGEFIDVEDTRSERGHGSRRAIEAIETTGELLARLSERQAAVVRMRHGVDCLPMTYRQIARELRMSAARVKAIYLTALEKMGEHTNTK